MKYFENNYIFYFFTLVVVILLSLYWTHFYFNRPLYVREIDVNFIVGDRVGFDLNTSLLAFGIIPPSGSSTRHLTIKNDNKFPIEAKFYATENVIDFIEIEHRAIIQPGENESIPFRIVVPVVAEKGNYSGKISVKVYKSSR